MTSRPAFRLHRNAFGRLVFTGEGGDACEATPVRAFPVSAPEEGIALIDAHGRELAWIDRLSELPEALRELVESEFASREFMPVIERIVEVSSFATPSVWTVITDRGETKFTLKGEENIRRLAAPTLLIADGNGIEYLIPDRQAFDAHSRGILDRFL
jgi:hypothetical protein